LWDSFLEHLDGDCTGEWQLEFWSRREYFRCSVCGVAYCSSEVMAAVVREIEMGVLLDALSTGEA